MHITHLRPIALLFVLVVLTPSALRGQFRTSVLPEGVEKPQSLLVGGEIPRQAADAAVTWSIPAWAERRPWWARHPVQAGAVAGAVAGLGISLVRAVASDFRCPAEYSFPCWWGVPLVTAGGAAVGALVGLIVSGPPPHAAPDASNATKPAPVRSFTSGAP